MKARETCKSVTRRVAISSPCNYTLRGMSYIAQKHVTHLFKNHEYPAFDLDFNSHVEFDDVFIHVRMNACTELRLIQKLITLRSPQRIIALVDYAHAPTLKLLRAMGVFFIVSLRDSLSNIGKLLQDSSIVRYMSPDLHAVIKEIQPAPVWAAEWDAFDGVQYLTPTETEIILDLLRGVSPWQLAKMRFVSVKTVSSHKLNAMKKIKLRGINEFFINKYL